MLIPRLSLFYFVSGKALEEGRVNPIRKVQVSSKDESAEAEAGKSTFCPEKSLPRRESTSEFTGSRLERTDQKVVVQGQDTIA